MAMMKSHDDKDEEITSGQKRKKDMSGSSHMKRKQKKQKGIELREKSSLSGWKISSSPSLESTMDAREWLDVQQKHVSL